MGKRAVLTIERMAAGGLGLGRYEGRIVFLAGVLPDESVEVEFFESKKDYLRARPLQVLEPHPDRRTPACRLFPVCGGCQLMHVFYRAQPELKAGPILENLRYPLDAPVKIIPAPQAYFYRDRVRLQTAEVQGSLRPGFYAAGSKRLIPIGFCHQVHPRINLVLPALSAWIEDMTGLKNGPYQLEVLAGAPDEGFILVLSLPGRPDSRLADIISSGPEIAGPFGIFTSVKGRVRAMKEKTGPGPGLTWFMDRELGIRLKALPGVFTQVNPAVNRLLIQGVLDAVKGEGRKRVLDLYAGFGNFSLPLAGTSREVVAIEENPAAVDNARYNLSINKTRNVKFIRKDAVRGVDDLLRKGEKFDSVVLDPPRSGARGLAPKLAGTGPAEIVYVSCHPAAMTRDLAEFASLGYEIREMTIYDMFPQTSHMEVLAVLAKSRR